MKERPILFSAPMVRALIDGTKTQTRRVVKQQPTDGWGFDGAYGRITSPHHKKGKFGAFIRRGVGTDFPETDLIVCPYGQPSDQLWVRETWWHDDEDNAIIYRADPDADIVDGNKCQTGSARYNWRPSIFMPRWASRILLEITAVRVERLQDISEADAMAEGVTKIRDACHVIKGFDYDLSGLCHTSAITPYYKLWESINGPYSWALNPWVWVIEFKREQPC